MGDAYREAQRSVIGSLVIDPGNTLGPVMDTVSPEHFEGEYRTVRQKVETGRLIGTNLAVKSGLARGDRIAVAGVTILTEGQTVTLYGE